MYDFSDAGCVYLGTEDGKLSLYSLSTNSQEFKAYLYNSPVTHLLMSSCGDSLIVTAKSDKIVTVWDRHKCMIFFLHLLSCYSNFFSHCVLVVKRFVQNKNIHILRNISLPVATFAYC